MFSAGRPSAGRDRYFFMSLFLFRIATAVVVGLFVTRSTVTALHVQIMVTSKFTSLDRRMILRDLFRHCSLHVSDVHFVEMLFFLGEVNLTAAGIRNDLALENHEFHDLVFVGGPDSDPPVDRDVTYVLDRPTARGFRLAYGTAWLAAHRPSLDYVMYLDDDSYLHIPRLLRFLELHNSESLAMGFLMETALDYSRTSACELCKKCDHCLQDQGLREFCRTFADLTLGGCLAAIANCRIFSANDDYALCVENTRERTLEVASYFDTSSAPRWMLGMGWVFGRRIVQYLARNAGLFKKRGAADVQLGLWLAPLEGVHWVDTKGGFFHDYPMPGSTFSTGCSEKTVLVHRMNEERWRDFVPSTCELRCPASASRD
eukprot:TRINITY_DN49814_c0_g1_i1.p1 TRINITY_DN49814_c0_g1~~TRINITY_DN49814_c0_g1_i1.p1  ORF type:complete len:373 (+),score=31.06 TRINITY_DN49814_c0_g1_i1:67-1185(+)